MFVLFCVRAHGLMPLPDEGRTIPWMPLYNWARRRYGLCYPDHARYVEEIPFWAHLDKVWMKSFVETTVHKG